MHAHRCVQCIGVGHDGDPAVVGHIERLMRIGGPGVGAFSACDQRAVASRRGRPEAECAIDVHPGVVAMCKINSGGDGVESAAMHIPSLQARRSPDCC